MKVLAVAFLPLLCVTLLFPGGAGAQKKGAKAGRSSTPPSGLYDVKVEVVSDTCTPAAAPTSLKGAALFGKTMDGQAYLNVPFPEPTGAAKGNVNRSDVLVKLNSSRRNASRSDPACAGHELARTFKMVEVARERIKLTVLVEHKGLCDGNKPRAKAKASCKTELAYTYVLKEAKCEAPCSGQGQARPGGGLDFKCLCP